MSTLAVSVGTRAVRSRTAQRVVLGLVAAAALVVVVPIVAIVVLVAVVAAAIPAADLGAMQVGAGGTVVYSTNGSTFVDTDPVDPARRPFTTVQAWLGHGSIEITARYLHHLGDSADRSALQLLSGVSAGHARPATGVILG